MLTVMSFGIMTPAEAADFRPKVAILGPDNHIAELKG